MKKVFFLFINWIIVLWVPAQNQDWEVYIGVTNKRTYASDIIECYDKGYYLGAWTGGSDGIGWNIKTGVNGNILYDEIISHNNAQLDTWAVASDLAGNIYFAGPIFINNASWPFVAKFDSCGEKVWCRSFPDYQFQYGGMACDVLINKNNEIIVLAEYTDDIGPANIYLIGLAEDGDVLWKKHYAKKEDYPLLTNPFPNDFIELNNEYFIAGYCYYPFPNNPNHVYLRPFFIGIDSIFKEKWILPFYKLDSVFGWAETIIPLNDTVFMGAGIRRYGDDCYALLMFFNKDGEETGYSQITNDQIAPDNKESWITDIKRINDSLFIAAAHFGPNVGENPIGEFVIDTAANLYNFHSRPNTQSKPRMVKTFDNNYVIVSNIKTSPTNWAIYLYKINANLEPVPFDTNQYVYDSLCPHTILSGTVDLTDCLVVTSIHDAPSPEQYYESIRWIPVKAFPNPVKEGKVTFAFENTEHHRNMELRIYNIFGSEVSRQRVYRSQQTTEMDITTWPDGIYLAVIFSNGGAVGRTKFVVE